MTLIVIELTDGERSMLRSGINEWGGPAAATDELALAMGFADRDDLHDHSARLWEAVKLASPMEALDWARVLVMTEFVFASDVFGSGRDWSITSGIPDDESIATLRSLQRKFGKAGVGRTQFSPTSHQEYEWHSSAATAIRVYKHGRSDLAGLVAAVSETVESFGEDLAALGRLADKLIELEALPETDQRAAVLAELDHLQAEFDERLGQRRRMFWL